MTTESGKPGILRDEKGRIVKGSGSLHPGGNTGTNGLVEYIKGRFGNNLEKLVDIINDILDDNRCSPANRLKAIDMLFSRVFGAPRQTIDNNVNLPEPIQFVVSNETDTSNKPV